MRVAITGTPGTGKSTVSSVLRSRGYNVLDITDFIKSNNLREEYDSERDTYDVDVEKLNNMLLDREDTIFESHLSHFLDVDMIIVLRCSPGVMKTRLESRGYSTEKVMENIQAELLDVILYESVESEIPTYVVDTSSDSSEDTASAIEDIMKGNTVGHMPEDVSWAEEMDKWF